MFHTTSGYGAILWAAGQSDTLRSQEIELSVPKNHIFRRIYLAWFHFQAGDPTIIGRIRFRSGRNAAADIPFRWAAGLAGAASNSSGDIWCPSFTVNRRASGVGNAYPYEIPATPDSKVMAFTYQEFGPGNTYHVQLTAQAYKVPSAGDSISVGVDVTSGTLGATGGLFMMFVSVDSLTVPW